MTFDDGSKEKWINVDKINQFPQSILNILFKKKESLRIPMLAAS